MKTIFSVRSRKELGDESTNVQMARFLARILVFVIFYVLIMNPLLSFYIDKVVMKNSLIRNSQSQFESFDSLDVLILGDSHSLLAVNPLLIPGSFNFSTNGESYLQTYYKALEILESNELGIQVIVLPLDLHSFSSFRTERIKDPLYWRRYIDYFDLASRLDLFTTMDLVAKAWIHPYIGELELASVNIDILSGNRDMQKLLGGYLPSDNSFEAYTSEDEKRAVAENRIQHHFGGSDPIDQRLIQSFSDIVEICSNENIEVAVVSYPISDQYVEAANFIVSREDLVLELGEIIRENANVHLFDYSDLFSGTPEYFSDSDHLNTQGACVMTLRLLKDIYRSDLIETQEEQQIQAYQN